MQDCSHLTSFSSLGRRRGWVRLVGGGGGGREEEEEEEEEDKKMSMSAVEKSDSL